MRLLLKLLEDVWLHGVNLSPSEDVMKKRWIIGAIGAACLACCAPLLVPLLAVGAAASAAGGAGLLFGLSLDQLVCIGGPLMLVAGAAAWVAIRAWRRRASRTCACDGACDVARCRPAGA
jgi:hypothetical protein